MVQAVRGMRDILPRDARHWRGVETQMREVLASYAYEEVQLPLLEFTDLFARGVGEATDIVEKEMYSLTDRDGVSLSLRPEGTAGCVRALQEHGLLYNQTQKVFYVGQMFRYEKPQKGRFRQFTQIGAEVFGFPGPDVDAELIAMNYAFWQRLGLADHVRLEINTLGDGDARGAYRAALVDYLTPHAAQLDEDSRRRLSTNPLRILDSKDARTREILSEAPRLPEFVDAASLAHFEQLQQLLSALAIPYTVNHGLVRGLDYYTRSVFEWITDDLGAQGTICGGGRYDGLVEKLGGKPTPAAGFGMGLDRLLLLHETVNQTPPSPAADVYVCYAQAEFLPQASQLADVMRQQVSGLRVRVHMGGGNFKKQLKRADGVGARYAVLLGNDEIEAGQLTLKDLRDGTQERLSQEQAAERIGASVLS